MQRLERKNEWNIRLEWLLNFNCCLRSMIKWRLRASIREVFHDSGSTPFGAASSFFAVLHPELLGWLFILNPFRTF